MLCLATAHHPADAKDTETTVVQLLASTLAHSVVGRLVASYELPVSRSPSSSSVEMFNLWRARVSPWPGRRRRLGMDWKLAKLSSSLTDDPAMLCLLLRSDWMLSMLLVSSSWLVALTLGLGSFVFLAEGGLDAGVAGELWFEPGFWLDGEKGCSLFS
nr:hypothetical protein Iba_chr09bCG2370 [Ipomoea batatas]